MSAYTSWVTKFRVTCDWDCHIRRPSTGGVDYAAPLGTPIYAPADGVVDYRVAGTGGYTTRITYSNGGKTEFMHCRRLNYLANGTRVKRGQQINITGGMPGEPGAGLSTGPHVHIHDITAGGTRVRPFTQVPTAPAALAPNQRVAGPNGVKRRSQPTSKSPEAGEFLPAGTVGNFNGWIRGENVQGNNVWFRGISGNWFWSGGFTSTSTAGLADLNPVAPPPPPPVVDKTKRTLVEIGANVRSEPKTSAAIVTTLGGGTTVTITEYVVGEEVKGNKNWGVYNGRYVWLGAFTNASTDGLKLVTNAPAPKNAEYPDATWIGSPAFTNQDGVKKEYIVLHWMAGTLAGTDATFSKAGAQVATHYGVGLTKVHQYVLEKDYAFANGNRPANEAGISIEHEGGYTKDGKVVQVADSTYVLSAKLIAYLAKKYDLGKLELGKTVRLHKDFVQTTCPGTLDHARLIKAANELNGYVDVPTPPVPPTPPVDEQTGVLKAILELLKKIANFLGVK